MRNKLKAMAIKCMFLGYPYGKKGYLCFDLINKKTCSSRDMKFLEDIPYYNQNKIDIFNEGEKLHIFFRSYTTTKLIRKYNCRSRN